MRKDRKWYQSKKFLTALTTAVLIALNDILGLQLDIKEMTVVIVPAIVYILTEFVLDQRRERGRVDPLADPVVREIVEYYVKQFDSRFDGGSESFSQEVEQIQNAAGAVMKKLYPGIEWHKNDALTREITRFLLKRKENGHKNLSPPFEKQKIRSSPHKPA